MTEDKKPGLTRRCKVQTWLFNMKLVTLAAFFVGGMIASIKNGQLGLWGNLAPPAARMSRFGVGISEP